MTSVNAAAGEKLQSRNSVEAVRAYAYKRFIYGMRHALYSDVLSMAKK